jgi:hypothetical protein
MTASQAQGGLDIEALRRALAQAGEAPVAVVQTHISWLLLGRVHAYKLKKPLTLPFLDYGTPEARRRCCEEELRLNRRLAPSLYLGLSAVTGSPQAPAIDGQGPVLDWAVRMRRFPAGALFSERLADGTLAAQDIDALAGALARFHGTAPVAADPRFGSPAQRRAVALDTAESLASHGVGTPLATWLRDEAARLAPLWSARRAAGRGREVHGDLHLDNLLLLDGAATAFDAVEFDPALRWIDVLDDMAFVAMDLVAHGRPDLGWRFVNAWMDATGDRDGVAALRFALVQRALVRARVATLREGAAGAVDRYVATAHALARRGEPRLLAMHGLPGSGKTFVSQQLLESAGAMRIRSDVERARLFGRGAYGAGHTAATYARLLVLARVALEAGYAVILDAAFLRRAERDEAAALAASLGVPFTLLECRADLALLQARVQARQARGGDASEADVAVLHRLAPLREPLQADEAARALVLDTGAPLDAASLARAWHGMR